MERQIVKGITIDSEQTRDIDDAIWIEFQSDGWWHILVTIADVAESVPPGGKFDVRAREMVTTKYFRTGNSPMLPRHFAEDELSLWAGKERKTLTIDLTLKTPEMEVQKVSVYPSILVSQARVTYDKIPFILKDKEHPQHSIIELGCRVAMMLLDRRRKAGAFVLYDLNTGWITTEEGFLRQIEKKEETIGYILIQELMVLANSQVAEFAVKNNIPVLFRNHVAMNAMPDRSILMAQIQDALTTPMADLDVVRQRTHMLLGRASYSDSLLGHYGLNLPAYLHFTSPIRRYADLITQRQIKAHLAGQPLPYDKKAIEEVALHINDTIELERERASMHFKTKDEQKAHRAIDSRRLDGLNAAMFERVTKVEARSGYDPSDAFEEAFLRRLRENRLPLISLTVILTQEGAMEGWRPVRQAIIDQLVKRPEDAVSILAQAQGVAEWPVTSYTTAHEGPDHARVFTAEATINFTEDHMAGPVTVVGHGNGNTAKLAKQFAAIDLLAKLGGQKVPEKVAKSGQPVPFKEHEVVRIAVAMPDKFLVVGSTGCVVHVHAEGEAYEVEFITNKGHEVLTLPRAHVMPLNAPVPEENKLKPVTPDMGKDPVSALMEYVQKAGLASPNFTFEKTGPDHIPTITCTCQMGTITKTARATSKQDAKKQAAKAILDALPVV